MQDEDCLYVNIFKPRAAKLTSAAPVGVFLPGGNYRQGGIGTPLYDGGPLVDTGNVVLVTSAYRLGALGFLAFGGPTGNYGLLDQQEMLRWLNVNIGAYGGDPKSITLYGQSAGATSVAVHLTIPSSIGLFQQAIMQSDPLELPIKTLKDQAFIGSAFLTSLGCKPNDMACLRSKSVDAIVAAQQASQDVINIVKPIELFYPWVPTIDNVMIKSQPIDAFQRGQFHQMPIMLGSVSEEAYIFIFMASAQPLTDLEYTAALVGVFGLKQAANMAFLYPPKPIFGDKRPQLATVATDMIFGCAARNVSSQMTGPSAPIYTYLFNHSMTFDAWGPEFNFCIGHVCHGAELPFSFGVQDPGVFQMTPAEQQMSQQMMEYWTNFMHTGNPNKGPSSPVLSWPQWTGASRPTMTFQTPSYVGPYWRQNFCEFWDRSGYHWGY